jgi:DNA-binding transcriptional MocR family regulator
MQEPFYFKAPARLVDFMRQADQPGLINLAAGVPGVDALPFEALPAAMKEAMRSEGPAIFAYHHPEGDRPLRELLAARLATRGVAGVSADDVVITTGCSQALSVMFSILLSPGDVVACEAAAYYGTLEMLAEHRVRVLPIPVSADGSGIDMDAADALVSRWKPRCMVVCTTLSNPTGGTLSQASRERLVAICRRAGTRLVEDDIFGELADAGAPRPCRAYDDGSTVSLVSSFSKTIAPGLRVGYCVPGRVLNASDATATNGTTVNSLHDAFSARKTQQDMHGSVVSEVALRVFLQQGNFDSHLTWLRERNKRRRALALGAIHRTFPAGTHVADPCGGFVLWVALPPAVNLATVREQAREVGVVFASGNVFFPTPEAQDAPTSVLDPHALSESPSPRYIRLNCAKAAETDLERGVELLGRIISAVV